MFEEYEVWADKGLHVAVEESVGRREESAQVWHHKRLGVIVILCIRQSNQIDMNI